MTERSSGRVRGGKDQFSWEAIKSDKYRQNYLGHSLMAPIGKWQEGKDLIWYSRQKGKGNNEATLSEQSKLEKELAAVRQKEAELLSSCANSALSSIKLIKKLEQPSPDYQTGISKSSIRDEPKELQEKEVVEKRKHKRHREPESVDSEISRFSRERTDYKRHQEKSYKEHNNKSSHRHHSNRY